MSQNLRLAARTAVAIFALTVISPNVAETADLRYSGPGQAQIGEACKALFAERKAEIERLAAGGDKAGIQAIFAKAGCPSVGITIARPPAAARLRPGAGPGPGPGARNITIICTSTFPPLHIECHFGAAAF